jgi:hypothetical protein
MMERKTQVQGYKVIERGKNGENLLLIPEVQTSFLL